MTDRRIFKPLKAVLAGAALFALAGALAPGYAGEPVPETDPVLAQQFDDAFPKFEVAPDGEALAVAEEDAGEEALWEQMGSGTASWYGPKFKGRPTASGETFDPTRYTAAHRTLPFGTRVRVSRGDRSVVVRINDRGPFAKDRVIDVSQAAAKHLGLIGPGHGTVSLALLSE